MELFLWLPEQKQKEGEIINPTPILMFVVMRIDQNLPLNVTTRLRPAALMPEPKTL
jgi:hypothetical protein